MTGFVYIWFDTKRKLFYIGSHKGLINDGYVSSNKRCNRVYNTRPQTMKRKILEFVDGDQKAILSAEQRWLDMIDDSELDLGSNKKNGTVRYYNIKKTAAGGNGVGSNGMLKDKKKYYNPETDEQKFFEEGFQPADWNRGVPSSKVSSSGKIWIHSETLNMRRRVEKITDALTTEGWSLGKNPPKIKEEKIDKRKIGRKLTTPMGNFDTLDQAAKILKISRSTIYSKLNNTNYPTWYYNDTGPSTVPITGKHGTAIVTPKGEFISQAEGARAHNMNKSTFYSRLYNPNFPDWYIKENK